MRDPEGYRESGESKHCPLSAEHAAVEEHINASRGDTRGDVQKHVSTASSVESTDKERNFSRPQMREESKDPKWPERQHSAAVPAAVQSSTPAPQTYAFNPQEVTSGTVKSGLAWGAIAGATTGAYAGLSTGSIAAGALAAGSAIASGAITGGITYLLGEGHNALWAKEGRKKPGILGTFGRGIIAPISIPLGLIRNLTWNKKGG